MPTSSTVDTTNLPPNLGADVQRVIPATGRPTKETQDNELIERDWFMSTVINMETRLTEVRADTDTASAAVITEAIARASGDTAQASLTQSVEAALSGGAVVSGSATTQMRMIAVAAPTGYSSAFSLYLRASGTNYPVGMQMLVGGGVGSIAFTAQQFSLTDPSYNGGLPNNVFLYSGGVFQFNVPVLFNTGEIAANAVSKPRTATASGAASVQIIASDWTPGSELLIIAVASSTVGYANSAVTAIPTGNSYIQVNVDGSLQKQAYVPIPVDNRWNGSANVAWWQAPQGFIVAHFTTTSANHTVAALWKTGAGGTNMPSADWELVVWEYKR
jgi:hypothetical protein